MAKRFTFSPFISAIGVIAVILSLRLSYWQYRRHHEKLLYIETLNSRLNEPVVPLSELIAAQKDPLKPQGWSETIHRRVSVEGEFDFAHEMVLRNRRYEAFPGVYAITPLKIRGSDYYILVSRGFIPLKFSSKEQRAQYQKPNSLSFTGLAQESVPQKFLAPSDPEAGAGHPWVDGWLRVDIPEMEKQLPYKVLPIFVEVMETSDTKGVEEKIISEKGGREDVFFIADKDKRIRSDEEIPAITYPAPVFDTVISPGRHKGYIFEWIGIAFLFGAGSIILQLKRPTGSKPS